MATPIMAAAAAMPSIAPWERPPPPPPDEDELSVKEFVVVAVVEPLGVFVPPACSTDAVNPKGFVVSDASVLPIAVT